MEQSSQKLFERIISAVILLSFIFLILRFGDYIGVQLLVLVIAGLCFYEYFNMLFPSDEFLHHKWLGLTLGMLTLFVHVAGYSEYVFDALALGLFAFFLFYLSKSIELKVSIQDISYDLAFSVLGVFYICFFLGYFPLIRLLENGEKWIILILLIAWGSDIGAYIGGRTFGTRKLLPQVSPHKTVEGAYSGFVGAILFLELYKIFLFHSLSLFEVIFLGIVGSILSQIGDLCESLLKRNFNVKDSGNVIPGHGGMLDCIDSVLFVAPFIYLYIRFVT